MKNIDGLRPNKKKLQSPHKNIRSASYGSFFGADEKSAAVPLRHQNFNPNYRSLDLRERSLRTSTNQQKTPTESYDEMLLNFSKSKNVIHDKTTSEELFEKSPKNDNLMSMDISNTERPSSKKSHNFLKRFFRPRRIISLAISLVVFALVFRYSDGFIRKITGGKSGIFDALHSVTSDKTAPLAADGSGRTNILLFGTSGYDMAGKNGQTVHDGAALTDSIMYLSIDQKTNSIAMLNIPRDLKTKGTCTETGKINEVYWCSNLHGKNESAGAEALKSTIEEILDTKIHYFAHLNWGALVKTVDLFGGITVVLDEDINDTWTKTFIKKNTPTSLNGEQALGLARARHGTVGGDFSRGNSQQKILIALQQKMVQQKFDFTKTMNIINIIGDNLRTNFKVEEIKTMTKIAQNFKPENLSQIKLQKPGSEEKYIKNATINGISYVVPTAGIGEYKYIQKYIKDIISGNIEESAKITVLNGSSASGAAARERVRLETAGFNVQDIGDISGDFKDKSYYAYDLTNKNPKTKSKLTEFYTNVKFSEKSTLPNAILSKYQSSDFIVVIGDKD